MKVHAVIVTFNGEEWIRKCLQSLVGGSIPIDVIVIDNSSKDQTVSIIKNEYRSVQLIENASNFGFGQANNIGLKMALQQNADYVFLLNQDAWVQRNTVESLVSLLSLHKEYGIVAPFQLDYEGNKIEKYFNDFVIGQYAPAYISDFYQRQLKPIYPATFIHAAGWLIPKTILREIGGFDPLFFHYGEDNDYVQRLHHKKYLIGFVPQAIMYHRGSNDGLKPEANEMLKTNFALLKLKNPSASLAGGIVIFLKGVFDAITSALVYRSLKTVKIESKVFFKVLKLIPILRRSKKLQMTTSAYLN